MDYILSLDVGKYETKTIGRSAESTKEDVRRVHFRTKSYNLADGYIDVEGNSHKIVYKDQEYIVGDQGETKSKETSKTNILHLLCAYSAITQYLKPDTKDNKIYLTLACPLSVLKIESAKKEYKEFIKGEGPIDIVVDDKNYNFEIVDITIKAEGSGLVYIEPDIFKNETVLVTDFGGLNMGLALYRNKVCVPSERYSEEYGSDKLTDLTREELIKLKHGNIVQPEQAAEALVKGFLNENGKPLSGSAEAITIAKQKFFNGALSKIEDHNIKIDSVKPVFVGGTTEKIKEVISSQMQNACIPEEPQWVTVRGLYKVAAAKYEKLKAKV